MAQNLVERARSNAGQVATQDKSQSVVEQIRSMREQFQLAMPKGAEATQLIRDALTAVRTTRNLDKCTPATVLGALMTCAQLNLRVGVLGQAWVLPFWSNKNKCLEAQVIVGYKGYIELAHRSGRVGNVTARLVHANDRYDVFYGTDERIEHRRPENPEQDRGPVVAYYATVKYLNGGSGFWEMTKKEVEDHRDRFATTKTKEGKIFGPWVDHFDAMGRKTCVRMLANYMPSSPEDHFGYALAVDGTVRRDYSDLDMGIDAVLNVEHPDVVEGDVVDEPATLTKDQAVEQIAAWLKDHKVTGAQRIDLIKALCGRPDVASTDDMTNEDAATVLARLTAIGDHADTASEIRRVLQEAAS